MSIWFKEFDLDSLNKFGNNTLTKHLGIIVTNFGDNFLEGTMPVEDITRQPYGILHGGASCVLSESLGSIAANLSVDPNLYRAVGQHIEATHLRPVKEGIVTGIAKAIHVGKSSQLWRVEIFNAEKKLVCDSKILMAIVKV